MKILIVNNIQYELIDLNSALQLSYEFDFSKTLVEFEGRFYPVIIGYPNPMKHGLYLVPQVLYRLVTIDNPTWYISEYTLMDFNNIQSIADIYQQSNCLNNIVKPSLIADNKDKIYHHDISNNETSLMTALHLFMNAKQVDIDLYADRMKDFSNNKRLLKNKLEVSHKKFMEFMEAFDGKAKIVIENAEPNVPNPIPEPIIVELT